MARGVKIDECGARIVLNEGVPQPGFGIGENAAYQDWILLASLLGGKLADLTRVGQNGKAFRGHTSKPNRSEAHIKQDQEKCGNRVSRQGIMFDSDAGHKDSLSSVEHILLRTRSGG